MITRILIFSLLYCLPFYAFAQQSYPKQSILYENLLDYWYIKDLHQDSIQLVSLSDKLKVWKEKDGYWSIVPLKSSDTLRCLFIYKNILKDTLSFVVRPIPCDWIEVPTVLYMPEYLDVHLLNVYQNDISLSKWKQELQKRQVKTDTIPSNQIIVDFQVEAKENIKNMFPKEMRFKVENCELLVYDVEKQQVKYKKEYICSTWWTTEERMPVRRFTFDLLEWLPQMQIGNQFIIRFPHVLRMGYDQKLSVFTCEGSEFIEEVYQIVE
jgi:hypothetical protein